MEEGQGRSGGPSTRCFRSSMKKRWPIWNSRSTRLCGEALWAIWREAACWSPKMAASVPVENSISPILGASHHPRGAIMVFRDVTEQRRTENALRESEGRYRFLADAVPEFIFTTDAKGCWDYCNQRWYDYTGLTTDAIHGAAVGRGAASRGRRRSPPPDGPTPFGPARSMKPSTASEAVKANTVGFSPAGFPCVTTAATF